jgi:hypothetical protein
MKLKLVYFIGYIDVHWPVRLKSCNPAWRPCWAAGILQRWQRTCWQMLQMRTLTPVTAVLVAIASLNTSPTAHSVSPALQQASLATALQKCTQGVLASNLDRALVTLTVLSSSSWFSPGKCRDRTRGSVVLRHYATSQKVAGLGSLEVNAFFPIYLILPAALGPGVYSASNRNEYQEQRKMFLRSRSRPVRRADNLTAICVPIV